MKQHEHFSDEYLNAFIDGELEPAERSRMLLALNEDEELSHRVCELQKLRDMVKLAYHEPLLPKKQPSPSGQWRRQCGRAAAAGLLVMLGTTAGWVANSQYQSAQQPNLEFQTVASAEAAQNRLRLLLHVTTADPQQLDTALNEAENLLEAYRRDQRNADVEILTNGAGLELLRADVTLFADRIHQLKSKYNNLRFLACQQALDKLERETGIHAPLVPEASIVPSAVSEILNRKQKGWTYIQI